MQRAVVAPLTLPAPGLARLVAVAATEGHLFVARLRDEWTSGSNRFDRPGELLLGVTLNDALIAVGGLNADPYFGETGVGRLRRVYVDPPWRGRGIGRLLVTQLLERARRHFATVRLRTHSAGAASFYTRLGFRAVGAPQTTHEMVFD
jgi:GNAT superfamily N-acetyltransferase